MPALLLLCVDHCDACQIHDVLDLVAALEDVDGFVHPDEDVEDEFFFACFADAFGIPSPVSYYTVELLPYLAESFEQWERRMWDRQSLLERKGQQYHVH